MKNKAIKTVMFCLILLSRLNAIAQPGEGADTTGGAPTLEGSDATASSINDYIIPLVLIGVVLGFGLLKRKTNPAR